MDNRIVITGAGICCAVGTCVEEVLDSLRSARSGLKPYHCDKAPNLNARHAGTIERLPTSSIVSYSSVGIGAHCWLLTRLQKP